MVSMKMRSGVAVCFTAAALAWLSASPTTVFAQGQQCATNPFVGTWGLNLAKSKPTALAGHVGKDVFAVFALSGKDGWTYAEVDRSEPRLVSREQHYSAEFDGKDVMIKGADTHLVSVSRVDCNNYDLVSKRQVRVAPNGLMSDYHPEGVVDLRSRLTVSADGKTFTDAGRGLVYDRLGGPTGTATAQCSINPIFGVWKLEHKKSTITRVGGEIGDRIVIYAPYGKNGVTYLKLNQVPLQLGRNEYYAGEIDGKPEPTGGNDPRMMSIRRIDCNTFESTTRRQAKFDLEVGGRITAFVPEGAPESTSRIEISEDGKTLKTRHNGFLGNQTPVVEEKLSYMRL
jgi:hypothetical protein